MLESYYVEVYRYILDVEMMLLEEYKIDSISFIKDMTLMDLQSYVNRVIDRKKEEQEQRNKQMSKDKFTKSLIAIRDILNFMTGFKQ